jgi:hypothetical protein
LRKRTLAAVVAAFGLLVAGLLVFTAAAQPATFHHRPSHKPKPTRTPSPTPTITATPTVTPSVSVSPSVTPSSASPTATPVGAVCTNPVWSGTRHDDMFFDAGFIVHNNQWNASGYTVSQTVEACTYKSWNAIVTADNNNGDGAVKTYPNVHKDYHNWSTGAEPPLSNYPVLRSTFAADGPDSGIYNIAYDIWLNGVPGNREVMIWTDNQGQTPAGSIVANGISIGGKSWNLWATSDNHILTYVAVTDMTSGTVDLRAHLNDLITRGRVPATSTLGQICFGVEVVSTGGSPMTFNFTDFSLTDS